MSKTLVDSPRVADAIPCAHQWASMYILRAGRRVCLDCAADWYETTNDHRLEHVWRMHSQIMRRARR